MFSRRAVAVPVILMLALGMASCSPEPELPPQPPKVTQAPDPETELFTISQYWSPDDRGVDATAEQKAAFKEALMQAPDVHYRVDSEGVSDTFLWNVAYVGASAPEKVLTDAVLKADLSGQYKDKTGNTDLLGGVGDSEFMSYVAEETGIPEDARYFHVVAHLAQLGALHLR